MMNEISTQISSDYHTNYIFKTLTNALQCTSVSLLYINNGDVSVIYVAIFRLARTRNSHNYNVSESIHRQTFNIILAINQLDA